MESNVNYLNLNDYVGSKKLVLFGASVGGVNSLNMIGNSSQISYICDNDKKTQGKFLLGIEIKSPDALKNENKENLIVIVSSMYYKEICLQLLELGVKYILNHSNLMSFVQKQVPVVNVVGKEFHIDVNDNKVLSNISTLLSLVENDGDSKELLLYIIKERMIRESIDWDFIFSGKIGTPKYFSNEIYCDNNENEIIIDGGLFDSADFIHFYNILGSRLKRVYGFEPDKIGVARLENELSSVQVMDYNEKLFRSIDELIDIKLYPYALSDHNGPLNFSGGIVMDERKSGNSIESRCIDEMIDENEKITLIKLDIEGSELDALKGATRTILKHKPRLIVCLYHRPSDLWEIPIFIKKICPEYRLYVRPHNGHKTVLELHAVYK